MTVAADHATIAHRVDTLLHEIAEAPTVARARERADELARTIVELYGGALERILTVVHESAGDRSDAIFSALCEDRFVESLLVLHDLHPLSLEDRVQAALDSVRPYLESHAGGIEIVAVRDGVAYLRLEGTCDGCPSSEATVKLAVERAILDRIHEVTRVQVENVTPARAATPLTTLRIESDWIELADTPLNGGRCAQVVVSGTPVLLVAHNDDILAYRDRCPACASNFSAATFADPYLRCTSCGASYDVVHAGRAQDAAAASAEPFPLVRDGGRVRVAIPIGA